MQCLWLKTYINLKGSIYGFVHINEAVATFGIDPWKEQQNRMISERAHRAFVFYLALIYNLGKKNKKVLKCKICENVLRLE